MFPAGPSHRSTPTVSAREQCMLWAGVKGPWKQMCPQEGQRNKVGRGTVEMGDPAPGPHPYPARTLGQLLPLTQTLQGCPAQSLTHVCPQSNGPNPHAVLGRAGPFNPTTMTAVLLAQIHPVNKLTALQMPLTDIKSGFA